MPKGPRGEKRPADVIGHRGLGGPCSSDPWARGFGDMPIAALCPGHASRHALPSGAGLRSIQLPRLARDRLAAAAGGVPAVNLGHRHMQGVSDYARPIPHIAMPREMMLRSL